MSLFEKFDQHKVAYSYLVFMLYLMVNNGINASSVWLEHNRDGQAEIQFWEPFVWEYSSALSTLLIVPLLIILFKRLPLKLTHWRQQIAVHLIATIGFSFAHVSLMVMFREAIYWLNDQNYSFGPWSRELWYEYRKDAWGYFLFLVAYHVLLEIYQRLKGEANLIAEQTDSNHSPSPIPKHLLVRKLDKEFLVKVADVEWIESSGNYVNLHSRGRIYPLRSTLTKIADRLGEGGFTRIHRSLAVNHNAIDSISYQPSGDGDIHLKCGKKLNLSRRYKEQLKVALS